MSIDVSVIITSYNVSNYIERAVNSALSQDNVSVEVIIVDDCSTDDTWLIVSNLTGDNIKKYRLAENGGPSVARNKALKHCSGKWVAILDGDDAFEKSRLASMIHTAKNKHSDIVVDNLTVFCEEDNSTSDMFNPLSFNKLEYISLDKYIVSNQFKGKGYNLGYTKPLISRNFLEKHKLKYNPKIRIGEDYIFMLEALAYGGICAVNHNSGYIYTVRTHSISHRLTSTDIEIIRKIDAEFLSKHKLNKLALEAQKIREKSLKDIYAFSLFVESIKTKNIKGIINSLYISPTCPRHLLEAILKRIRIGT